MAYQAIPPASADSDPWVSAQTTFVRSRGLGLNRFIWIKAALSNMGQTTMGNDGATEGGARTTSSGAITWFGSSFFQAAKTSKWAMAIRGRLPLPVAGRSNAIGIINAATTHDILVGSYNSVSTTKYVLLCDGTASTSDITTLDITNAYHNFVITGDTANVKLYIDGTLYATRAIGTNVVDEPLYPFSLNTITADTAVSDFLMCVSAVVT